MNPGPSPDASLERYELVIAPAARRQLSHVLPEAAAFAAYAFIAGPLLRGPYRVDERPRPPLEDRSSARRGTYRVLYRVDDGRTAVSVLDVAHRRDVQRP